MYLESNERALDSVTIIKLVDYKGYDFNVNPGTVYFEITDYKQVFIYDEITKEPVLAPDGTHSFIILKGKLSERSMDLTWEVANQWGADDQVIFDYIIEQLNNES